MQIRSLESLSRDELIALIIKEREQAEAIGAGGVSLMGGISAESSCALLRGVVELATEAYDYWDSDKEMKVGKILLAMSGRLPRYDMRADAIHAALTQQEPK